DDSARGPWEPRRVCRRESALSRPPSPRLPVNTSDTDRVVRDEGRHANSRGRRHRGRRHRRDAGGCHGWGRERLEIRLSCRRFGTLDSRRTIQKSGSKRLQEWTKWSKLGYYSRLKP